MLFKDLDIISYLSKFNPAVLSLLCSELLDILFNW